MDTTVEQILTALNEEPHKGLGAFLLPEEYAQHLHTYVNLDENNKHNMQQPIDAAEVHRLAAAFGAYLLNTGIVVSDDLRELVTERAELPAAMPAILWSRGEDDYAFFLRALNNKAKQALRDKGGLITVDELLRLDPWFVILRNEG